jgi:hypothetical protein
VSVYSHTLALSGGSITGTDRLFADYTSFDTSASPPPPPDDPYANPTSTSQTFKEGGSGRTYRTRRARGSPSTRAEHRQRGLRLFPKQFRKQGSPNFARTAFSYVPELGV